MQPLKDMLNKTYQNMIDTNLDEKGNVIIENFLPLRVNEEIIDNMIYCTKCGEKKIFVGENWQGVKIARRCECKNCYEVEQQRIRQEEEKRNKKARIEKLKDRSLIDERYKDKRFTDLELTNESFINAYTRCKKYCEVSEKVYKNGYGIYLWGNSGTGKTLLTACMANELMEKEYTVLFTNFYEILKAIRNTYNNRTSETDDRIINDISEVDFLFIDDLGTESLSKNAGDNFTQDKIFEIINKRYNKQKPTIFNSNYHIKELVVNRNFMDKTVDRINEMSSAVIEIEGESYRTKMVINKNIPF